MLSRQADSIRNGVLADSKKKVQMAERMLGKVMSVSSAAEKKGREAKLLATDSARVSGCRCEQSGLGLRDCVGLSRRVALYRFYVLPKEDPNFPEALWILGPSF